MNVLFIVILSIVATGESSDLPESTVGRVAVEKAPDVAVETELPVSTQDHSTTAPRQPLKAGLGVKTDYAADQQYVGLNTTEQSKAAELKLSRASRTRIRKETAAKLRSESGSATGPLTFLERVKVRLLRAERQKPVRRSGADVVE